jgi:pimeloyl-ACP methyl ester carboxylesterase
VAIVGTDPGVEIWYDVTGVAGTPVVLLAGAASQAIQWEPPFIDPIVARGHRVVRFDWRDVGLSTWRSYREHPYTGADLAADMIAVIDDAGRTHPGFDRVHLVGFSMGGLVAQLVAGLHPERVRSLTTLSTGFAGQVVVDESPRYREVWEFLANERAAGPDDLESFLLRQWRLMSGCDIEFDEPAWRERIRAWVERGHNARCPHFAAPAYERTTGEWVGDPVARTEVVRRIACPTLVLHGDDDGMFAPGNAAAIAETVPHAEVHLLPGRGHDLFVEPLAPVHDLLLAHLEGT